METDKQSKAKNPSAVALGRLGGIASNGAYLRSLTPEQRREHAQNAAFSRWGKKQKGHSSRKWNQPGWVYFAQDQDRTKIKIGFTTNPRQRLSWLNTCESRVACPGRQILIIGLMPGTQRVEHEIHAEFAQERVAGSLEWFVEGGAVRAWLDTLSLFSLEEVQPNKKRGPKPRAMFQKRKG